MKILISDKAYEEYRELLQQRTVAKKEELKKSIKGINFFYNEENGLTTSAILALALICVILFILMITVLAEIDNGSRNRILLISIVVAVSLWACCVISNYSYQERSLDKIINTCENLSPDEFIKYLQQNYIRDYKYMNELLYLKNHQESITMVRVSENLHWIAIDYDKGGKIEIARLAYDSKNIRTDIAEDILEWLSNGEIHFTKVYTV